MPLRDLLITGILASTLPFVFRHVFIGVLLWTWISIMNPHRLAYGFIQSAPIAAAIAGVGVPPNCGAGFLFRTLTLK